MSPKPWSKRTRNVLLAIARRMPTRIATRIKKHVSDRTPRRGARKVKVAT